MKRIIMIAALAIGFLAWRMNAMQEDGQHLNQEVIIFKDKEGNQFNVPRNRVLLSGMMRNMVMDTKSNGPIQAEVNGIYTSAIINQFFNGPDYEYILSVHDTSIDVVKNLSNENREKKGQ